MVTFRQFFEIVHEEATRKGLSGPGTASRRRNLTSELSAFWRNNEATVRSWTLSEAREWARNNVSG